MIQISLYTYLSLMKHEILFKSNIDVMQANEIYFHINLLVKHNVKK